MCIRDRYNPTTVMLKVYITKISFKGCKQINSLYIHCKLGWGQTFAEFVTHFDTYNVLWFCACERDSFSDIQFEKMELNLNFC